MKTYIDGLQKALELLNNNPCDADGYHYCSQQDTYKNLIEAEIKVSRVKLPVKPANGGSELAEKLYNWMVNQKFSTGELLNAAVCCDYAGKRWLINTMQDIINKHLSV